MAEKQTIAVPEIIDNVEALEVKMQAMREAQKILLPLLRSRSIKFSTRQHLQPTK